VKGPRTAHKVDAAFLFFFLFLLRSPHFVGVAAGFLDVASQLARVERALARVEEELAIVGEKLAPLEGKPLQQRSDEEKDEIKQLRKEKEQLREKEKQLREKEKQLRKEKEQLREKEKQLREEKKRAEEKELLLLQSQMSAQPQPVDLILRPWIGFEEVDPRNVRVDSMDQLMKEAKELVRAKGNEFIKLYYCVLNEKGLPIDKERRTHVSTPANFIDAKREAGGVIWVCVGGSPSTSPQKRKPRSPFLVEEYASVEFADLPELYEDSAFKSLKTALTLRAQDPQLLLMMAIPGSGKSRTVMSACASAKIRQVRIKFLDGGTLGAIHSCIRGVSDSLSYQAWKDKLSKVIKGLLDEKLGSIVGPCVVHIDDAQTLMGTSVVSREQWDADKAKGDPWDLVMPTVCSVLNSHLNEFHDRRCVVSGTNFFARLVVSAGSEAKTDPIVIDGTFPPEWVMSNLVNKYFRMPNDLKDDMLEHMTFLCGNRRAVQHFLVLLKHAVVDMREGDQFAALDLRKVRNEAFSKWSVPIVRALKSPSSVAVQAVAALVFPEALSGLRKDGCIKFPLGKLPQSVKEFGLAGGLNLWIDASDVVVSVPRGCVWEFLSSLVAKSFAARSNVEEVGAFVRVAKSVDIDKGHVFERLFACELSLMGCDGGGPLYAWIAKAWRGRGKLTPDPLVFGQPFVYESCIRDVRWAPHQVYCVEEKAGEVGKRVVDVGFPVFLIEENSPVERIRIMCELKKGYTQAKLWRLCWAYFDKMKQFVMENKDVYVCFVATVSFCNHEPASRDVETGTSAHDSRKKCLELMKENPHFMILDDVVSHSRFPLAEIFVNGADPEIEGLSDGISSMYLGTPLKDASRDEK